MNFIPERLISAREALGINKAEAARRLNMSAMGYGRYEKGERIPSFQTLSFIAQKFNTSVEFLCGMSQNSAVESITVSSAENPDLFELIQKIQYGPEDTVKRLLAYMKSM